MQKNRSAMCVNLQTFAHHRKCHMESERKMSNTQSTKAELAAIADTLDRCRERLSTLGASRLMAIRDPKNADAGDDLLTAIYESERGLNTALRLVQRAARQGR